jgi:hypothetical protein
MLVLATMSCGIFANISHTAFIAFISFFGSALASTANAMP